MWVEIQRNHFGWPDFSSRQDNIIVNAVEVNSLNMGIDAVFTL